MQETEIAIRRPRVGLIENLKRSRQSVLGAQSIGSRSRSAWHREIIDGADRFFSGLGGFPAQGTCLWTGFRGIPGLDNFLQAISLVGSMGQVAAKLNQALGQNWSTQTSRTKNEERISAPIFG